MVYFHKLVRDRIPEIIERAGERPITRKMEDGEYRKALEDKLEEEVAEYLEGRALEELADILEVVRALCQVQGHSIEELGELAEKKRRERGGFGERIFLIGKEEADQG